MGQPGVDDLGEVLDALRSWQQDGAPVQLHPGDLGWYWRFGAPALAAAVRTWRRGRRLLAVGLLDGPGLLRLGVAPEAVDDAALARRVVADVAPSRGLLPEGDASVEARCGDVLRALLLDAGWERGEPWAPLRRDLADHVEDAGVRVERVDRGTADARAAVHRAAFPRSTFTVERWQEMAAGPAYADARCLMAYDDRGAAVASVTVWSAGPGRPGLLEPMGVHHEHRGRGYGTAVCVAAAAELREMGASSALVCTPSANEAAVATYASAGFRRLPDVPDLERRGRA